MIQCRNTQGFTLVETMVAGGLLVSVSLVALVWFNDTSDLYWTTLAQQQLRTDVHQATRRLTDELRMATRTSGVASPPRAVIGGAAQNALTCYLPTDGVDANTLIIDDFGNTEWDLTAPPNNPTQVVYSVNAAGQLIRTQGNQARVLASNVQSVRFDDATSDGTLAANEIRVRLTLQMTAASNRRALQARSNEIIRLRN